jgi:hypothetical protein
MSFADNFPTVDLSEDTVFNKTDISNINTNFNELFSSNNLREQLNAFDYYVYNNDYDIIVSMFEKYNYQPCNYIRCQEYAIKYDRLEILQYLLQFTNKNNFNHLFNVAVLYNSKNIVQYLINNMEIDINNSDDLPLRIAVSRNHESLVDLLLDNGANVNCDESWCLRNSFYYAKQNLIISLLNRGANINAMDDECLILSIEDNDKLLIEIALENGADGNARNNLPLFYAITNCNIPVIQLLEKYGVKFSDIEISNNSLINECKSDFQYLMALVDNDIHKLISILATRTNKFNLLNEEYNPFSDSDDY